MLLVLVLVLLVLVLLVLVLVLLLLRGRARARVRARAWLKALNAPGLRSCGVARSRPRAAATSTHAASKGQYR